MYGLDGNWNTQKNQGKMHYLCSCDTLVCLYCLMNNGGPLWAEMGPVGFHSGPITHRWARRMGPKPNPFVGWVGLGYGLCGLCRGLGVT